VNKEKLIKELNRLGGYQAMVSVYGHNRQYWHWRATTWGIEPYKQLVEYEYVRPPIKMKKIVRKFRFKLDK